MNTESPFEGDGLSGGEEPSYEWLDEWLCEYVDGTMDPSLETVFEQYVEANPELKSHVKRLEETRELLCSCGLPTDSSAGVQAEVCREVECDMRESSPSVSETVRNRPVAAVGLISSVAAALVIGFLVGAMVMQPASSGPEPADRLATETEREPPLLHRTRVNPGDGVDRLLRRSAGPFAAPDSAQPTSPIPTVKRARAATR